MSTKKKITLYFTEEMLNETRQEALRQDRSLSWVLEVAWKIARERMREMPGVDDFGLDGDSFEKAS